jgi:hypothetical protein
MLQDLRGSADGWVGMRDLNCVESSSTLERIEPFDHNHLTTKISCIPISLCLCK